MKAVVLLTISNIFMTATCYGHLKYLPAAKWPLLGVILISWGIAFFEYCFQVPANRIGYATFSAMQLKILQEVISISIFVVFAIAVLGEKLRWNHAISFLLVLGAVYFAFLKPAAEGS